MAATSHPVFPEPENLNVPVWRYMDFTKLVSMLTRRGLFFSSMDCLGDAFEGSFPVLNTRDDLIVLPPEMAEDLEQIRFSMRKHREFVKHSRKWTYASCWHMSEHESAAMWKLYARTEEAVAIRSTFSKLKCTLPKETYVGCVKYIDYDNASVPTDNAFWPFMHKRLSFEHEREVRALSWDKKCFSAWSHLSGPIQPPEPPAKGLWKDANLVELIDTVFVAPTAPEWFRETVEATIRRFDFSIPVVRSRLDDSPLW